MTLQKHAKLSRAGARLAHTFPFVLITIPFCGAFFFRGLILKPTCKQKACQGRQSENTAQLAPSSPEYFVLRRLSTLQSGRLFLYYTIFLFPIIPLSFSHFPIYIISWRLRLFFPLFIIPPSSPSSTWADPPLSSTSTSPLLNFPSGIVFYRLS